MIVPPIVGSGTDPLITKQQFFDNEKDGWSSNTWPHCPQKRKDAPKQCNQLEYEKMREKTRALTESFQ